MPIATALSIITKLGGSGLQRVGSMVFQKVFRLWKIDSAFRGKILKSTAVKIAIDDFQAVMGSYYGAFDEQLGAFVEELERSGIITLMIENSLLNGTSSACYDRFIGLHHTVFGDKEAEGRLLFEKMSTAFAITLNELCQDKGVAELIRATHSDLSAKILRIDEMVTGLCTSQKSTPLNVIRANYPKLSRSLQALYRDIRIETNKGPRFVDIRKIYVAPDMRYRHRTGRFERIASIVKSNPDLLERSHARNDEIFTVESELNSISVIKYNQLRSTFSRVIILGDPGGGKSTLCQNICYDLAKQASAPTQLASKAVDSQLQRFPFRIILRSYERARVTEPQLTILEYLVRDLESHINIPKIEITETVTFLLEIGRAVLAFDGLDEILVSAQRRDFVDLVLSFCNQYPLCPTIVTSRLVGYDDAPLSDEFEEVVIEPFNDNQVQTYIRNFMSAVASKKSDEADMQSKRFLSQTERNASDLRKNPLMLGLMAWIYNNRGDVPYNRPEIYRECAVLMFDRWDQDRNIHADVPDDFDRLQLFSYLADKIFENREFRAGVSTDWLQKQIQAYLVKIYEKPSVAYSASNKLVKYMCTRAWAMNEVGENIYTFTHQTFLEYFFSMHLDDTTDNVSALLLLLIPKVANREWDVVSHLALQIKTHRKLLRQEGALRDLSTHLQIPRTQSETKALSNFCAKSLEYLPGPEADVRRLVIDIVRISMERIKSGDSGGIVDICLCEQVAMERREFVTSILVDELGKLLRSTNDQICRSAIIVLTPSIFGPVNAFDRFEEAPASLSLSLTNAVKTSVKSYLLGRKEPTAAQVLATWHWYSIMTEKNIKTISLSSLYSCMLSETVSVDGLTSLILCSSGGFKDLFPNSSLTHISARETLTQIGKNLTHLLLTPATPTLLSSPLSTAPAEVYISCVNRMKEHGPAYVGALASLIYIAQTKRSGFKEDLPDYLSTEISEIEKYVTESIKDSALTTNDDRSKLRSSMKSGGIIGCDNFTAP